MAQLSMTKPLCLLERTETLFCKLATVKDSKADVSSFSPSPGGNASNQDMAKNSKQACALTSDTKKILAHYS